MVYSIQVCDLAYASARLFTADDANSIATRHACAASHVPHACLPEKLHGLQETFHGLCFSVLNLATRDI